MAPLGANHGDCAEVDEGHLAVGVDEDVARVRVDMEEAVLEDHLEVGAESERRIPLGVISEYLDALDIVDADTFDILHDKHP